MVTDFKLIYSIKNYIKSATAHCSYIILSILYLENQSTLCKKWIDLISYVGQKGKINISISSVCATNYLGVL